MSVKVINLDERSMNATSGQYGVVSAYQNDKFSEKYINLNMLIEDVQLKCDALAEMMAAPPENADIVAITSEWRGLHTFLGELKGYRQHD